MIRAMFRLVFALFSFFTETLISFLSKIVFLRIPHWRLPPGPLANCFPIFGSLPLFALKPSHLVLAKIAEKYKLIYRLRLGKTTFVVICDHALLQDTFEKEAMCGRNMLPMMAVLSRHGLIHAEGDCWKNQRSFVHQVLRDIGLPRTEESRAFHGKAGEAIDSFLEEMKNTQGQSFDEALSFTLVNIFFSMIVGRNFERNDELLKSIIGSIHESCQASQPFSFANFIPFFARLPSYKKILENIKVRRERFTNYMQIVIQDHRQNLDPNNPKDLIDAYLVQMANGKSFFTEPQLNAVLEDLFISNLETVAATIRWLLLALVKYPDMQENIYERLSEVTKNERPPTLDDRINLPYLEATILEGYRFSTILPHGVPHSATEDTKIAGYHIPKNSTIVGLFWKFNRDRNLWDNPNSFDPTNHINEDGTLIRNKYLMPYSVGRRMCITDAVANDEIFLILANLVQKFQIQPSEDNAELPSLDDSLDGILRVPRPYNVKLVLRHSERHRHESHR